MAFCKRREEEFSLKKLGSKKSNSLRDNKTKAIIGIILIHAERIELDEALILCDGLSAFKTIHFKVVLVVVKMTRNWRGSSFDEK